MKLFPMLFPAVAAMVPMSGLFAEDAYVQADGTQYIKTGYFANPNTKVVCDFAYTSTSPQQQRIFGADDDGSTAGLSFSSYINGGGCYAWAFQNGAGNWASTAVTADTTRRTLTLDGPGNKVSILTGSAVTYSAAIATTRTKTSIWPLAIFGNNRSTNYSGVSSSHSAKAKLYSLAIYDGGTLVRYYLPYRSADATVVGLKEMVSGEVVTSPVGHAFTCGGDISDDPAWNLPGVRQGAGGAVEYLTTVNAGTDGTAEIKLNGVVQTGATEVWATSNDVVEITAIPAAGKRFVKWDGEKVSFAPGSYLGSTNLVLRPAGATSLVANWVTPHTRTWVGQTSGKNGTSTVYFWKEAANWKDETNATGKPTLGDTVIFDGSGNVPYQVSESSAANPLHEVRWTKAKSNNQGSIALLAGGMGIQYLATANSGSNWSGLYLVGDGPIPVNIANNVSFEMQKACTLGTKAGYGGTPIVVKQGPGTVINCNQSGNYTYSAPVTVIQQGRWDITLTSTLQGCLIGFDGAESKRLTFCNASYTTDLAINNGGIYEINDAANHEIGANNRQGQLIFTGTPKFNPMVFSGRFTAGAGLKWNPNGDDFTFVCSNAVSDTNGKLTVSKGTVKLVAGATFTALGELSVAEGAVFEVASGAGANFYGTALVLGGPQAKLKVPAGVTLAFESSSISGAAMSPGVYSAAGGEGSRKAAWIEGEGTVTVANGPADSATWCGGDSESTLVTRDANWLEGSAPSLTTGTLLATFATGGAEARLGGAANFLGLVFNSAFGGSAFSFTTTGGTGATVGGTGITATDAASATTWSMGWPVELGADQTWTLGQNNTLKLDAPLSGSSALTVEGTGTVHFNAESTHSGALELKGGTVKVSANNGLGTADRTVEFHHMLTKYVFSGDITLDAPMYSSDLCESSTSFMSVEPNSHVTFNGNFGYKAQGGITFGAGSVTVFKNGLRFTTDGMKGMLYPYGSGTIIVSNKNISTIRSWQGSSGHPVTLELAAQWNILNDASYWAKFRSGRLVTRVDKALDTAGNFLYLDDVEFDLDGHDQQVGLLAATAKARITSARPATLTVASTSAGDGQDGTQGGDNRVDLAVYSGQVSFRKPGAKPHTFGAVSTTTGAVEVTAGTITMNANGQWPNATEVRVAGGSIVAKNALAFGSNAVWRVTAASDPVVTLDFSGTAACEKLYVDGKRQKGGVYGAVGSGAGCEAAWLGGTGFLKVKENSTAIVFR